MRVFWALFAAMLLAGCGGAQVGELAEQSEGMAPAAAMTDAEDPGHNTEDYAAIVENPFLRAADSPLSTFSIDVDTASYANVRRFLRQNTMPPAGAVRIEELINYFPYDYQPPAEEHPFSVNVEVAGCPWKQEHRLVRIGLRGREFEENRRPASNLVFLIDVSGSMDSPDKLPLLKQGLKLLVDRLAEHDRVAIVVYASATGLVLPSTSGAHKTRILEALDRLSAGGSTNGGAGIQLAYQTAVDNLIPRGVNRVVFCTDGDFNVGVTSGSELTRLIQKKAKTGVFLSVLGFGTGNLKDSKMEQLADQGNGNYAYIDTVKEAHKVLVEQAGGTLIAIAKDVKIQVEFNPAQVEGYRLIGYENRLLRDQDFNDDTKDAGEIGAGHTVTALYEVVPAGMELDAAKVDPLKYQAKTEAKAADEASHELLTVKLRYKRPFGEESEKLEVPVVDEGVSYGQASTDFKFASAVASFGMLLRESPARGDATYAKVMELASEATGADIGGYRSEFCELVRIADRLTTTIAERD